MIYALDLLTHSISKSHFGVNAIGILILPVKKTPPRQKTDLDTGKLPVEFVCITTVSCPGSGLLRWETVMSLTLTAQEWIGLLV